MCAQSFIHLQAEQNTSLSFEKSSPMTSSLNLAAPFAIRRRAPACALFTTEGWSGCAMRLLVRDDSQ